MSEKKNVVVVGAGFSGIFGAKKIAKKLKNNKDYQVVVVDKHSFMTYMTELHEVAAERVMPDHVQEDLREWFHKTPNVKVVTAEVTKVDAKKKIITTNQGEIPYEKLLVATGGESNDFGTPGVKEYGYELWSFEQALAIREHLREVITDASLEADPVKREEMLNIMIVGSGFTGVELVGELIEWREVIAKETKLNPDDIKLTMLEAAPTILNMLTDRNLADKAERYMTDHGVTIQKGAQVTGVTENSVLFKDGSSLPTRSLIWTAGVKNKSLLGKWGLKYEEGRGGRVKVDENMRVIGFDDIYAAGDAVEWVDPVAGPTPQTVQGGESMVTAAAANIVNEIKGKPLVKFKRVDWGYAVSIGSHYTVAALFGHFNFGGFFANLVKHGINLFYFMQIKAGGSIIKYLNDEIFRMENGREPFFGMVSRRGNVLWTLLLRIAVGVAFINAGVGNSMNVPTFTGNASADFVSVIIGLGVLAGLFGAPLAALGFLVTLIFGFVNGFTLTSVLLSFASLALANGVSYSFGLDHWVMRFAKKTWKNFWYGEKQISYDELDSDK
ncbi:MAG: FAD-dependent oxidoreductase [Lactobacillaceae bacterium]|jgi:NADH dehydrogenase|nr:FAD-dependent oxidoreductase [Lactobacillaceae bacterium]